MSVIRFLFALLAALFAPVPGQATETADAMSPAFFSTYEGRTLFPMGETVNRILRVSIRPFERNGFSLAWETTISERATGSARRAQALDFIPTARAGVYTTAGDPATADDVVKGASLAWAVVVGETLTVHVFTIVENGDYVVQTYLRRLTKLGLDLEFHRVRNGKTEQQIKGILQRIHDQ